MLTEHIRVAEGVELAVDSFAALDATEGRKPGSSAASAASAPGPYSTPEPAFVLVHGLASNARMWDGVAARLASAGNSAFAVDLRGHGRSSKPDGPYDMPTVADDLLALIDALKLDRPVVAGQSWGGNVVLELGARHPGSVRGVVCVDGGWLEPSHVFPDWESCREALAPPRLAGLPRTDIEAHARAAHPDWPESGIRGALANFEVRPDDTVAPWLTFERHLAVLRGMWDHHPSARYPELRLPVLLVPAESGDDAWIERKRTDVAAAAAAIPAARVCWMHGDHDLHAQHPNELADLMLDAVADGFLA